MAGTSLKNILICSLLIIFGILLRFTDLEHDSLWLDESYQTMVSAFGHGLPDVTSLKNSRWIFKFGEPSSVHMLLQNFRSVDPLCPPLYPLLLNRWMLICGQADWVIRSLSAIFSCLALISTTTFTYLLCGPTIAIAATALQAVSPFDIHYAQEARMYSLVVLSAILSNGSLILFLSKDQQKPMQFALMIIYALSTWSLINSHYTGLFLCLGQGVIVLTHFLLFQNWRRLVVVCLAWELILLLCLPWIPLFLQAATRRGDAFYVVRQPSFWWPFYAIFVRIGVNADIMMCGQRVAAYAIPVYISGAIFLLAAIWQTKIQITTRTLQQGLKNNFPLVALWIWFLIPPLTLAILDIKDNRKVLEITRYTIGCAPAVFMLAAHGYGWLQKQGKKWHYLMTLHIFFALINLCYMHLVPQREPWKEVALAVEKQVPSLELVITSQHYDLICLNRYLHHERRQIGVSPVQGAQHLKNILAGQNSFTLITAQDGESILPLVPTSYELLVQTDYKHGLHLRRYQLK